MWISDANGESIWGVDPPAVLYYWSSAQETPARQTPQLADAHHCRRGTNSLQFNPPHPLIKCMWPTRQQGGKSVLHFTSPSSQVHERSVHSDFLLTILKDVVMRRSDLQLILMSATVDCDKFSNYFNRCPVITIPGRTFPVEVGRALEVHVFTCLHSVIEVLWKWKSLESCICLLILLKHFWYSIKNLKLNKN